MGFIEAVFQTIIESILEGFLFSGICKILKLTGGTFFSPIGRLEKAIARIHEP